MNPSQRTASPNGTTIAVDHPTLWVINRQTGEMRETTYQAEESKVPALSPETFYLPPNPTTNQVLTQYPEEVQKAYRDAMRQLVQVSRARRSPIEKIHERHTRMGMSMKDYLHYLWSSTPTDQEEKWYGELRLERFQGRSTNSTEGETAQFISDIRQFYNELESSGVNLCDLSLAGCEHNLERLYQYLESARCEKYQKALRDAIRNNNRKRQFVHRYGIIPEHVPFFDTEFYDMDVDSITTRPQFKLSAHVRHAPLTVEQCQNLSTHQTIIRTNDIANNASNTDISPNCPSPVKWLIGGELKRDFTKSGYGELFYPIRDDFKTNKKEYRVNSSKRERQLPFPRKSGVVRVSIPKYTYQEDVIIMGKHNQAIRDPKFQEELSRMLGSETGDAPKAPKKGKKHKGKNKRSDTDVFGNRIDFSNKGKKKKKDDDKPKKKDKDTDDRGTIDIDDSMETTDAAKAIGKAVKSDKLRKLLAKSINQGKKK